MTVTDALLLGVLQGITEFLPISSDGHLALAEMFLGVRDDPRNLLAFDVLLHGGTLVAILVCYAATWKRMLLSCFSGDRQARRLLLLIALATIPAALAGVVLDEVVATTLRSAPVIAVSFLITAAVLILGELPHSRLRAFAERWRREDMTRLHPLQAILIGCAQAFALGPGLSRSGLTISAGRAVGLNRTEALDFSFLMAFPIITGAVGFTVLKGAHGEVVLPPGEVTLAGFVAALAASIAAIQFLRRWARTRSLAWFALYLIPAGLVLLVREYGFSEAWEEAQVAEALRAYGAVAVFLFALLETVPVTGFFSPGLVALVLAGTLVDTPATLVLYIAAAVTGTAIGNVVLFAIGACCGRALAHRVHLTEERLHVVDRFIKRFGRMSVVVGQFVGFVRPAIAFVAGAGGMATASYLAAMFLSAIAWAAFFLTLGMVLNEHVRWVASVIGFGGWAIALIALAATYVVRWRRTRNGNERGIPSTK